MAGDSSKLDRQANLVGLTIDIVYALTSAVLGYPAKRVALGVNITRAANSRTNGRRGTSEAAIESSQCEDSYELLFFKVMCEVKARSKVKCTCLWIIGRRDRAINSSVSPQKFHVHNDNPVGSGEWGKFAVFLDSDIFRN